mgnify:CR=1 FL=1
MRQLPVPRTRRCGRAANRGRPLAPPTWGVVGSAKATASLMKKIGAIKPDKEPVAFENLVDPSVWKDANAMVK